MLSFSEAKIVDRAEGQNGHTHGTDESAYSPIYVVGFDVEDCAPKRGRGRFRIRRNLQLGKAPKDMSPITVENREMRMNVRILYREERATGIDCFYFTVEIGCILSRWLNIPRRR